jgi:hypothetical protein
MYSPSAALLFALFSAEIVSAHPNAHFYKKGSAADGDKRSPCPALNTLANHGHLLVFLNL